MAQSSKDVAGNSLCERAKQAVEGYRVPVMASWSLIVLWYEARVQWVARIADRVAQRKGPGVATFKEQLAQVCFHYGRL
jgi:hypothetical protein